MLVRVSKGETVQGHGSIVSVEGEVLSDEGEATGRFVRFGGDAREMADLLEAVQEMGEANASVESWQILGGGL